MMSDPVDRTAVDRIAVVRALPGVGDLLCAVPALRALRGAHPTAHITLVGLPTAGWFVDRFPHLIDDLLPVRGVPGLPEVVPDPTAAVAFYATAQARRFDLALQLHGSGVVTNPLTAMLGAPRMAATHLDGQWCPPGVVVSHPAADHEILRLLAVTTAAGCPPAGGDIDMPVHPAEEAEARALVGDVTDGLGDPCPYACLHPGASRESNRWPPDRFARVGDRLRQAGMTVVLTGTDQERPVVDAVARAMTGPAIDACGRTGVGTLAALFAGAALVVSNDTGAAHVAAAVRAPSVVVFRAGADHERWAPLDTVRHVPVVPPPDDDDPWPTVDDVLAGAVRHLTEQLARRPVEEAS